VAQAGFVAEDDLIQSAANYSKDECLSERRQLVTELVRIQNELMGAKAEGDKRSVEALGLKHQSIQKRLTLINQRMHDIQDADAFRRAVIELVPHDTLDRIFIREREIRKEHTETPTGETHG